MRVFDASCATILSAGARRGAQMGVLRADHPDIEAFVHAKDRSGALEHFNLSVAADDAFLEAVERDAELELVHAAEPGPALQQAGAHRRGDGLWVYRRVRAKALFEDLTGRAYRYGDPGMLYLGTINRDNNLDYVETLRATNPCAEQPLPPFGCCCLGSLDLTRFVRAPFSASARFDHGAMEAVVPAAVRMLDRVLDISYWPLPEQRLEAQHKRRLGLGFTGLGDALIMLGLRYDSEAGRATAAEIARRLRDAAYRASVALAREKGPFPLFDAAAYGRSPFVRRLPEALQEAIAAHGIRNSHLLSIAPTGTISLAFADNVSTGIEPAYAWSYRRRKRTADGWRTYRVEDHAHRRYRAEHDPTGPLPEAFVSAQALRVEDHLQMMAAVAPFVDAGISKTVNVPADYPFAEFADLYLRAWRLGLKALATFRPNPEREAVLSIDADGDCPACD
jgi:ribonucleoside-diphosphate reductase alpha chain